MQPNTISPNVDALNDGNPVAETYKRFEYAGNRSIYIGENHSPSARDTIALYRSFPTKNGNFNGVTKSSVKTTLDCIVSGVDAETTLTAPAICEVSYSFPVGVSLADQRKIRQRLLAVQDLDVIMDPLSYQGEI